MIDATEFVEELVDESLPQLERILRVVEVRLRPNPKLLDCRGEIAAALSDELGLTKWTIARNVAEVADENGMLKCAISHRNFLVRELDGDGRNFMTRYQHLVKLVSKHRVFADCLHVERIGVRFRTALEFDGAFEELRDRVMRMCPLEQQLARELGIHNGASIADVAFTHILREANWSTLSSVGPMQGSEFVQAFDGNGEFPAVGLFIDLDVYSEPKKKLPSSSLIERIDQQVFRAQSVKETLRRFMGV